LMKLGRTEPGLKIRENLVYFDWLSHTFKKNEGTYLEKLLPVFREKVYLKLNTLIYVHDISYQRLDDLKADFNEIHSAIHRINKNFQVILLINRSHLIPNELERSKIQTNVKNALQQMVPTDITSYLVSLKGPDEQRTTNLVFTQIINRASSYSKDISQELNQKTETLNNSQIRKIRRFFKDRREEMGFAGAYLIGKDQEIKVAVGKSEGWETKVGPQIVRMLAHYNTFDLGPQFKVDIIRIEDFLMVTKRINEDFKLIMIGREAVITLKDITYPEIEERCKEFAENILECLK
ncbi:MAG: hypothetical protein KAR20_08300, partial [Candidatus Heimdallarchaeota archaeon]|nr:hypothetical protein [Candidatus Heimdallarchaeota archaeon]